MACFTGNRGHGDYIQDAAAAEACCSLLFYMFLSSGYISVFIIPSTWAFYLTSVLIGIGAASEFPWHEFYCDIRRRIVFMCLHLQDCVMLSMWQNSIIVTCCRAAEILWPSISCSPDVRKHVCLVRTPTNVASSWFQQVSVKMIQKWSLPLITNHIVIAISAQTIAIWFNLLCSSNFEITSGGGDRLRVTIL